MIQKLLECGANGENVETQMLDHSVSAESCLRQRGAAASYIPLTLWKRAAYY